MEGYTGFAAKVPIPRLRRSDQQVASSSRPPRVRSETVNKACMRCRKRKTKCSGTRPRCTSCDKHDDECVYEQPRRDRLRDAMHKNETLIALLKDVRDGLSEEHLSMVDETLQQYDDDTPPSTPILSTMAVERRPQQTLDGVGRKTTRPNDSQTESNMEIDEFDEDVSSDQGVSSVGYLGRNSQVQWMRTLQRKLVQDEPPDLSHSLHGDTEGAAPRRMHVSRGHPQGTSATQPLGECYFYLDNTALEEIDHVVPDHVPPINTAKQLLKLYQDAVQTPFRILDGQFEDQLRTYYEMLQRGTTTNICPRWRAIMNLVFAIGYRYSQFVGATWQTGVDDQHVYMSRAVHLLGFHKISNFAGPPDQSLIQATGLLSLYFLIIGHVNRAWTTIGISLRYAQAAGIHLQNEDPSVSPTDKQNVAQIWKSLHSVECILTSITGRPRIIDPRDCTVALSIDPESTFGKSKQSMSAQKTPSIRSLSIHHTDGYSSLDTDKCLEAWIRLDVIQHKVLASLYSARCVGRPWKSIQAQISTLMVEMEEWAQEALISADPGHPTTENSHQTREHVLLFLYYQSARICVTRPCLCRLDRRLEDRKEGSANFVQDTADACIQAALNIASGFPKHVSYRWLYEMGPWWSGIHIIMQAITVLLLELTQRTSSLSKDPFYIFACVENLVQWLKALKSVDRVAENAYSLVCDMLRKYKRFAKDALPQQWLAGEIELPNHDAAMFAERPNSTSQPMNAQEYPPHQNIYPFHTNDNAYPAEQDGNLSPNPLEDTSGGFHFGQTQYTPYYNSQFTTLFDQEMGDERDGNHDEEGWNPPFE